MKPKQIDIEEYLKQTKPRYNGAGYDRARDQSRLSEQTARVFNLMRDGQWRTLPQMEEATGDPPASISAQLRHLRKERFGSHKVERRYVGEGLYQYRLIVNPQMECA